MVGIRAGDQRLHSGKVGALVKTMVAVLLDAVTMGQAVAAASNPSLCKAGETPLFSCSIDHKVVSICSDGAKATFYFGSRNHIELSSQALSMADHMFSGGGETQISFSRGDYGYIFYDKTIRTSFSADGRNDPESTSGLVVQKDGKTVSTKQCSLDAAISSDAHRFIKPRPFMQH